jgi:hypothetical protein
METVGLVDMSAGCQGGVRRRLRQTHGPISTRKLSEQRCKSEISEALFAVAQEKCR